MLQKPTSHTNNKSYYFIYGVLVILVISFVYRPVFLHQFINLDDDKFIYENEIIKKDKIDFISIFKEQIFTPNYKPLVNITWSIQYQFFSTKAEHFHFINLLIHCLNAFLVFLLLILLIKNFFRYDSILLKVSILTLIFAIHPLKVESVNWITELKDLLFAFFFLLSLLFYILYMERKRKYYLLISILSFGFGIFTKSMIISLPFILLIFDFLYGKTVKDNILIEKWPFMIILSIGLYVFGIPVLFVGSFLVLYLLGSYFITRISINLFNISKRTYFLIIGVAALVCIVLWLLNKFGINTVLLKNKSDFALSDEPIINFIIIASYRAWIWITKLFFPYDLALIYTYPTFLANQQLHLLTLLFPLSLLFFIGFLIYRFRKEKLFITAILFFLITLFPAILSSPRGTNFLADRYTYISSVSYCLLGLYLFTIPQKYLKILYALLVIYIFYLGYVTNGYSKSWRDSVSIWTASLKNNETWQAYFNRSQAYYILKENEKSISDINRAIQLDSTVSDSYFNRGLNFMTLKNYPRAICDFNKVAQLDPENLKALTYKSMALFFLGEYNASVASCNIVLAKDSLNSKTYLIRAVANEKLLEFNSAIADFDKIIRLEPQNGEMYYKRGITKLLNKDTIESCRDWITSKSLHYAKADEMIQKYCNKKIKL